MDLALIADKTESIHQDKFELLKGFLLEITDSMDISPVTTHEAVITFANYPKVLNTFGDVSYYSNENMSILVYKIDDKLSHPTRIDRALEAANEQLFTKEGGDRPDFPNSLVLLTDGKTHKDSKPYDKIIPLLEVRNGLFTAGLVSLHQRGADVVFISTLRRPLLTSLVIESVLVRVRIVLKKKKGC